MEGEKYGIIECVSRWVGKQILHVFLFVYREGTVFVYMRISVNKLITKGREKMRFRVCEMNDNEDDSRKKD